MYIPRSRQTHDVIAAHIERGKDMRAQAIRRAGIWLSRRPNVLRLAIGALVAVGYAAFTLS